jgi:hypothetical protein
MEDKQRIRKGIRRSFVQLRRLGVEMEERLIDTDELAWRVSVDKDVERFEEEQRKLGRYQNFWDRPSVEAVESVETLLEGLRYFTVAAATAQMLPYEVHSLADLQFHVQQMEKALAQLQSALKEVSALCTSNAVIPESLNAATCKAEEAGVLLKEIRRELDYLGRLLAEVEEETGRLATWSGVWEPTS